MADIFISYARADRDWVKDLATQLEAEGFSVWWDSNLLPGTKFQNSIDKELHRAKAAIVVWSMLSVESDWVRDEAEDARQLHILVPVMKDPVRPPHGFRQIQTADLSQWRGRREHPEFRLMIEGIAALIGSAPAQPVEPLANQQTAPLRKTEPEQPRIIRPVEKDIFAQNWTKSLPKNWLVLAGGGLAAIALIAYLMGGGDHRNPGGGDTLAAVPGGNSANQELAFWNSVSASNDAAQYQAYLAKYPQGTFADLARMKMAAGAPKQTPAPQPAANVPSAQNLNTAVREAVEKARAEEAAAGERASAARDAQIKSRDADKAAKDAAVKARAKTAGYAVQTGTTSAKVAWTYEGQVSSDNKANGYGVISFGNGNSYSGQWQADQESGLGVYSYASGQRYEGQYQSDKKNGVGVSTWPDGDRYEGAFQQDKRNGSGIFYGGTTHTYSLQAGRFANDDLSGDAIIFWKDGTRHEGYWKDDKLNGYGAKFDAKGGVTEQGVYETGTLKTKLNP